MNTYPKVLGGNVQHTNTGLPSTASKDGNGKTTPLLKGPHEDKDSEGFKPSVVIEPLTTNVANPSRTDAKYQADQTQSDRLRPELLKALNRVFKTLEANYVLKNDMKKMAKTTTTTSGNLTSLAKLLRNANLPEVLTKELHQDPDEPIRVPYDIHGKIYRLTNDEIQAHLDKEEEIKRKAKEAKLLAMTKSELIKVVHK
nr:hypothetical protein [Tanacetum cinerariifolium]